MDLVLTAAVFYAWQCLAWLPTCAVAFAPWPRRPRALPGHGLQLLHPWPGARSLIAARFPFALGFEGLRPAAANGLLEGSDELSFKALTEASSRADRLKLGDRTLLRCGSRERAAWLSAVLRSLSAAEPEARSASWEERLRRSLDFQRAAQTWRTLRRAIAPLTWTCSASLLLLFAVTPITLAVSTDAERVLARVALPFVGLHLLGLITLWRAQRQLRGRANAEQLFASALFPPALWRTPQALADTALVGLHPATAAALLLDPQPLEAFLRRELARIDAERATPPGPAASLLETERECIRAIAAQRGLVPGALELPLRRSDPAGERYCPLCSDAFRPGYRTCADCRVPTVAYEPLEPIPAAG